MKNEHIEYTTLDEMIANLTEIRSRLPGDTAVCVRGKAFVYAIDMPYYYDGGFRAKSVDEEKWLDSKDYASGICHKAVGFPDACVELMERELETDTD